MPPPQGIVCKICGGKFMKHSYPIHAPRCQKKFDLSHTKCEVCLRMISNVDIMRHKGECKPTAETKRRDKAIKKREKMAAEQAARRVEAAKNRKVEISATCEECEKAPSTLFCEECEQSLCVGCSKNIHNKGARRAHEISKLSADGEVGASNIDEIKLGGGTFDPNALGPDAFAFPDEAEDDGREACVKCGRKFNKDRIYIHERICQKTGDKKRRKWDGAKKRVENTDFAEYNTKKHRPQTPPEVIEWRKNGRRWKSERNQFRSLVETEAKMAGIQLEEKEPPKPKSLAEPKFRPKPVSPIKSSKRPPISADATVTTRNKILESVPDSQQLVRALDRQMAPKKEEEKKKENKAVAARREPPPRKQLPIAAANNVTLQSAPLRRGHSAERIRAREEREQRTHRLEATATQSAAPVMAAAAAPRQPSRAQLAREAAMQRRQSESKKKPVVVEKATAGRVGGAAMGLGGSRAQKSSSGKTMVRSSYTDSRIAREREKAALKALRASKRAASGKPIKKKKTSPGLVSSSRSANSLLGQGRMARTGSQIIAAAASSKKKTERRRSPPPPRSRPAAPTAARAEPIRAAAPPRASTMASDPVPAPSRAVHAAAPRPVVPATTGQLTMADYRERERLRRAARDGNAGGRRSSATAASTSKQSFRPAAPVAIKKKASPSPVQPRRVLERESAPVVPAAAAAAADVATTIASDKKADAFTVPVNEGKPLGKMPNFTKPVDKMVRARERKEKAEKNRGYQVAAVPTSRKLKPVLQDGKLTHVLKNSSAKGETADADRVRASRAAFLDRLNNK